MADEPLSTTLLASADFDSDSDGIASLGISLALGADEAPVPAVAAVTYVAWLSIRSSRFVPTIVVFWSANTGSEDKCPELGEEGRFLQQNTEKLSIKL